MDYQKPMQVKQTEKEANQEEPHDPVGERLYFTVPARRLRMEKRRSGH